MIETFLACQTYVINVINFCLKVKVFYPMYMLVFFPHPFRTAHPIDIHLGAFLTPSRLLQPPRLFTLRLFSNPPLVATPFYSGLESMHKNLYQKILINNKYLLGYLLRCHIQPDVGNPGTPEASIPNHSSQIDHGMISSSDLNQTIRIDFPWAASSSSPIHHTNHA